jgi:hypothetical protein
MTLAFDRAAVSPQLLLCACDAAERLGGEEDIALLEQQTRRLDLAASFKVTDTDHILALRDRLASEPARKKRWADAVDKALARRGLTRREDGLVQREDGTQMVLVAPGSFMRGADHLEDACPRRRVHVGTLLVDAMPVSPEVLRRFVQEHPSAVTLRDGYFPVLTASSGGPDGGVSVTWFAASAYARAAGGVLPTEAQWEKVAQSAQGSRPGRHPVTIGASLEWVRDAYRADGYELGGLYDPLIEPSRPEDLRVMRGSAAGSVEPALRTSAHPISGALDLTIGCRVVIELPEVDGDRALANDASPSGGANTTLGGTGNEL